MVMSMLRRTYCNPYYTINGGSGGGGAPPAGQPPTITVQPVNASVTEPDTATFSVTATNPVGFVALAYQWQKNGVDISGATSSSYTTPATTVLMDSSQYRCRVSNESGGYVFSNSATLTVAASTVPAGPSFTTHPTDLTLLTTGSGFMMVTASGYPAPTYQWEEYTTAWADMPGKTTNRLDFANPAALMNGRKYRCKATNSHGGGTTVTSNSATLYVNVPITNLVFSPDVAIMHMYTANPVFTLTGVSTTTKYATTYTFPSDPAILAPTGTYVVGWNGGAVASYNPTSLISPSVGTNDRISHEVWYTGSIGGDGRLRVEFGATGGAGWNYTFGSTPTARVVISEITLNSGTSTAGASENSTLTIEVLEGATVKGSLTLTSGGLAAWKASLALGPAAGPWVFQVPNLTNPVGNNLKVRVTLDSKAFKFGSGLGTHNFNHVTITDMHVVG